MSSQPRPGSRALAAVLMSLLALLALALLPPWSAGAGERSKHPASTTTWSSSGSSSKSVRTEIRDKNGTSYSFTDSDDQDSDGPAEVHAYVLWSDDHSRTGSGSMNDWRDAEDTRRDADESVAFWFRRGDDRYLITDPGLLRQVDEMFAPQRELGRRQGLLGRKQGEFGRLQGDLGRKQGELGRLQDRKSVV